MSPHNRRGLMWITSMVLAGTGIARVICTRVRLHLAGKSTNLAGKLPNLADTLPSGEGYGRQR